MLYDLYSKPWLTLRCFQCFPIEIPGATGNFKLKYNLLDHAKEKWVRCVTAEFMSSEESDDINDFIVVKPLLWRSAKATEFLQNLNLLGIEGKTKQAQRQRKKEC